VLAVVLALGGIAAYIWFRYEWQFGINAIVATFHDTITTVGLFALLGLEFNLTTVAAVLTIAGYSVNDTVVIYDRVREELRRYKKMPLYDLINMAVNKTLSRTVVTSGLTLLSVLALYGFGGEVLRGFSLAMIWGIVIGSYSTVFIATPLLLA
jgi:preprotein translocase SecF subunit